LLVRKKVENMSFFSSYVVRFHSQGGSTITIAYDTAQTAVSTAARLTHAKTGVFSLEFWLRVGVVNVRVGWGVQATLQCVGSALRKLSRRIEGRS